MSRQQSLDTFIARLAQKIATIYPSNCADIEDYIQTGHLKLAEIHRDEQEKRNFRAYAIIAVARAMRHAALEAMCAASAPYRVKRQIHKISMLLIAGKTEHEICQELKITGRTLANLKSLIIAESWHKLFEEPTYDSESFSILNDILSSCHLTEEDRTFILAQFDDTTDNLGLTRNQLYRKAKNIRPKLIWGGYGV